MQYIHYKKHCLSAGELFVAIEPYFIYSVPGSYVTTCLWDKDHRVGGMGLLAQTECVDGIASSDNYGAIALRNLFERMLAVGCRSDTLRARVFSGSCALDQTDSIPETCSKNMQMTGRSLADEGMPLVGDHVNVGFASSLLFNTYYGSVIVEDLSPVRDRLPIRPHRILL